ncbi:NAD(P)-dependent glycerol-3-phosphate dehydrogenase [Nordella sp. HKS 07]|uniref:NAD(P)H-dependent glycerol-3-phosphate dehydrogenase n=1 Tax=Nordella sp. HKS 07 TaxID=2712222 RepID=UPI0013E11A96|nr:NAD(P)H-dependent glycerol-3-phosphate dehydrogenase [Nordella sp. HKS 07]QIG48009.1 NAD(P)-dependent glycerol-3-phosphate dehydrogenase [Nordella sp. HKS 07]
MSRIGVLGAGAWGMALASVAERAGHDVTVWARKPETAALINGTHRLEVRLPGIEFGKKLRATSDPSDLSGVDAVLAMVPAQVLRGVLAQFQHLKVPVVLCAKGIEADSGLLMNEVLAQCLPEVPGLILSGPSFAADVARGLPTAVTLASSDLRLAKDWAQALSLPTFRIYPSDDPRGVELGGAVKNVLAIACGIAAGKNLGDSARAALTTRAFTELTRFGKALGGRPETLTGLSGLGDLLLTCSSRQSRNYSFGLALGEGKSAEAALAEARGTVEGIATARIVARLAREQSIDMPISVAVAAVIDGASDPETEIARLLARPINPEFHRG